MAPSVELLLPTCARGSPRKSGQMKKRANHNLFVQKAK